MLDFYCFIASTAIFLKTYCNRFVRLIQDYPVNIDPADNISCSKPTEADEAVIGLMAKNIANGNDFPFYFWEQHYMGVFEAFCVTFFIRSQNLRYFG
jgi:hypothetical protein